MKIRLTFFSLLFLCVVLIFGCTVRQANENPVMVETFSQNNKATREEIVPTPTPTARKTNTPERQEQNRDGNVAMPKGTQTPDVLLEGHSELTLPSSLLFVFGFEFSCGPSGQQIFLLDPPYEELHGFSGSQPDRDFQYPAWSPDGKLIAYVEAKYIVVREGSPTPAPEGFAIIVSNPDGSNKRSFPQHFLAYYFEGTPGLCDPLSKGSYLYGLTWSEDGRRIASRYVEVVRDKLTLSILNIETESNTIITLDHSWYSDIVWASDLGGFVVIDPDGRLSVYSILNGHAVLDRSFNIPDEIPQKANSSFLTTSKFHPRLDDQKRLLITFSYNPGSDPYHTLWEFDIETGIWNKLIMLDETVYQWVLTKDWVITCLDDHQFMAFNRNNWQKYVIDLENPKEQFGTFVTIPVTYGDNMVSFIRKDETTEEESLWVMKFGEDFYQLEEILSLNDLGVGTGYDPDHEPFGLYGVSSFEWQP
jgi:hypothetical protein